jgi:hypothetical protein
LIHLDNIHIGDIFVGLKKQKGYVFANENTPELVLDTCGEVNLPVINGGLVSRSSEFLSACPGSIV